jgi:hypothetical protein
LDRERIHCCLGREVRRKIGGPPVELGDDDRVIQLVRVIAAVKAPPIEVATATARPTSWPAAKEHRRQLVQEFVLHCEWYLSLARCHLRVFNKSVELQRQLVTR